ncbi:thioredoxin domain-containing protein [Chitinophagaceae bacterium LB-8]|uniref:Thioredoxin domain-containing protein n=1 Tax=Paraflavisolibacter caeni TaxID=2982496 RepID=A0A9X2XUC7_9BACT|nr:thioredoxin domain-containing protein [Paraflavisolibacter caeni]MCU7548522.1 thioredoxin domain-containing protein [Paraflavisolibacter caeni]
MSPFINRLAKETSPYLLQHAHNPVDWYPWGEEAFAKAQSEDKPILVSIGYAACHWCHVMERESFENPDVAAIMNEHFVNIKVDREERPDVDHIYMDAVQAMTGSGGWPLNAFLTPDGKPFYGGTYFPPQRAFNRASWTEVLQAIVKSYTEKRDEIVEQAENLTDHLERSNSFGIETPADNVSKELVDTAFQNIMKNADKVWGGFGRAPKFPQTFVIQFLLRYAQLTGNQEAKEQALLSLDKMMQGGIYDHVGGGFARYSTDTEWLVPHFEKMLYDNALLISSLSEAYQATKEEKYKEVIDETLRFIESDLMHVDGGFFSALDADSEGEEGKFYVWDYEEVRAIVGENADIFCQYFNIKKEGNWEGKNILHTSLAIEDFASQNRLSPAALRVIISDGKRKLLEARSNRIKPLLDDKVILSWNALVNRAYSKAYAATGNVHYREVAERNMQFLLNAFTNGSEWWHTWKNGQAKHPAFLDDFATLIAALIELAQVTADYKWLRLGETLSEEVMKQFADTESAFFFYTNVTQKDVLLRKKELYDGAVPSGNSLMACNLYYLSLFFDKPEWRKRAETMVLSLCDVVVKYPTSFGVWLSDLFEIIYGINEIAVVGPGYNESLKELLSVYIPHKVLMAAGTADSSLPLLKDKSGDGLQIYLCKGYVCQQPVKTIEALRSLMQV